MGYKEKASRDQIMLLPDSIDEYVCEDNPVRVIDAFVDSLNMVKLDFTKSKPADTGCPAYDPSDMLKLYIYGYYNRIRSSRKLMVECGRNVEVMWLMGKLQPDFRTISDFRKENTKSLREVFREFVRLCDKLKLYNKELLAVDGTKIRAQNSNDKCFNVDALNRKLANIDEHISEYLRTTEKADEYDRDESLTALQVQVALAELMTRKQKYEGYLSELMTTEKTQINVCLKYDKDERMYNLDYESLDNAEELKGSTKPEDIEKCLRAGVLPDCYEGTAVSVEVQELSTISCFIVPAT